MIIHTSEHYPYSGLCVLSQMCPNLVEHMTPLHFILCHSSLGLQLSNTSLKTGKMSVF